MNKTSWKMNVRPIKAIEDSKGDENYINLP